MFGGVNTTRDERKFDHESACYRFCEAVYRRLCLDTRVPPGIVHAVLSCSLVPRAPYDLKAVQPLAIPAVISLAFWGGAWGGWLFGRFSKM
jgi:hypothetical protein